MESIKRFFHSFGRAWGKIWEELLISLIIVIGITVSLSLLYYFVEKAEQPDSYTDWTDAFAWATTRYIEGGDGAFEGAPVTLIGRWIAGILGFVGLALVAIPAGILGSGFSDAMAEEKREKELERFYKIMKHAFKAGPKGRLRQYLDKLPKDENAWYRGCNFGSIANNVAVAKFQLNGMELKDILDVCKEHPEFRVKNEASAKSIEDGKEDRYMLEYFPVNKPYGYFIDRESKVTIVSTSSVTELCTGNFSYYLAKFAGFNYISKDFNAADGESFYTNHWKEPFYEGMTMQERIDKGEKITKAMRKAYEDKKALRKEFLKDLESLCKEEDSWVITILSHIKDQDNKVDIHVTHSLADGSMSTIHDNEKYEELLSSLNKNLQEISERNNEQGSCNIPCPCPCNQNVQQFQELQLSVEETTRYPLIKRGKYCNLIYKLQDDGCKCNGLTLRVSSQLMEFDTRMRVAQFIMSKTIHDVIEPEHRLKPTEIEDMNRSNRFYGFTDQKIDEYKKSLFKAE